MSEQDREKIDRLNQQVDILYRQGRYSEAIRIGIQARELAQHLLEEEDLTSATCLNNLGMIYDAVGNHEQAADLYTKALAMRRKILGEAHPAVAQSLHNLAALSEALGDYTTAEELYQQALAIRRKRLIHNCDPWILPKEYYGKEKVKIISEHIAAGVATDIPGRKSSATLWPGSGGGQHLEPERDTPSRSRGWNLDRRGCLQPGSPRDQTCRAFSLRNRPG